MNPSATLNGQELELFRVGDYGAKGKYTAADMQGLVARYSAAGETPIAIGHVRSDKEPAYGWIKSVRFSGETLYGTPGDVTPELDELHRQKKYKNRSVAFGRDNRGQMYMHHVAVLGAVPPEVQGLKPANFSSDTYQEFSDSEINKGDEMDEQQVKKTVTDSIREFFSTLGGNAKTVESVDQAKLTADVTAAVEAKFSAELATEKAARQAVEKSFDEHKKSVATVSFSARAEKAIHELKAKGAWVPAYDKLGVPELFSALAESDKIVTFSDVDGKEQKPDLLDATLAVFSAVGKIVPAGKLAAGKTGETAQAAVEANGIEVDQASVTFSDMISKRMEEKDIPYVEAYKQLSAEGKRPASGASAGAV